MDGDAQATTMRVLAVGAGRVLLPGERLDMRLQAELWRPRLRDAGTPGLAVFFRPIPDDAFPEIGTLAAIVGRRGSGDLIHVRLRGLRRVRTLRPVPGPAELVDVIVDDAPRAAAGAGAPMDELLALLRRYHAALAEHGERADIAVELPAEPEAAAYRVASLLRISAHERQFLLEAGTPEERVRRVAAVLRREIGLLHRSMGSKGA